MKKLLLNSLTTAFFLSLVLVISCGKGGDDEPDTTPEEVQFAKLEGTWTLTSVTNNTNQVSGWDGFELTISGSASNVQFSTNGAGGNGTVQPEGTTDVWPGSGTLIFSNADEVREMTRGGITLNITVSGDTLQISFTVDTSGGRTDEVDGDWVFSFQRKA